MATPPVPLPRSLVRLLTRSAALMLQASAYDGQPLPVRLRLALLRASEELTRQLARRSSPPAS